MGQNEIKSTPERIIRSFSNKSAEIKHVIRNKEFNVKFYVSNSKIISHFWSRSEGIVRNK